MPKITAAITGVGGYVPEYRLTNKELEKMVDTNDEWIQSRTGVIERRILKGEGLGSSARMMLSSMKSEDVRSAIMQGNVRLMESVKGIGKKTAERLILELKDKVSKGPVSNVNIAVTGNNIEQDAITALTALGISRIQAEQAIRKIYLSDPSISQLEELIKKALKAI